MRGVTGIGVRLEGCSVVLGRRRVLDDVSLDLAPGDKLLLVGPNGAGKTQLIKLLGGLRWPTASVGKGRRNFRDARGRGLDPVEVRARVAYVGAESQDKYSRYGWNHSLASVVATGLFGTDIPLDPLTPPLRRRVASLLARFGLGDVASAGFLEVSYGQRRLALVARALASRPRLLLLDEVFNGLDAGHRQRLSGILRDVARTRQTVVASAHRPEDVPPGMKRAMRIDHGRVQRLPVSRAVAWLAAGRPDTTPGRQGTVPTAGNEPLVSLQQVTVYRGERPALRSLDWSLRDGEHWAVTGRNGSGKSTFLGVLYGSHAVALGGRVRRRGQPAGTPLDDIRRRLAIVSPELQADFDALSTLEEIVVSGLRDSIGLDRPPTRQERRRAREALDWLGLLPLARRRPRELSYGELRLALFARALVKRPRVLLLDEPFTGLDRHRREQLRRALSRVAATGTQLVMAVHHGDDLPPEINRWLRLARGSLAVAATNRPQSPASRIGRSSRQRRGAPVK